MSFCTDRRADQPGDDSIDTHGRREIGGGLLGQRIDRALGYGIGRAAGTRSLAGTGGNIDDGAAALLFHHLAGVLKAKKIAGQVNRHNPVPFFEGSFQQAGAR